MENFQLEVNEDARDIKRRVEALRDKINEHRGSRENFGGFLVGQLDSYIDSFDAQIEKMNRQLDSDKAYWLSEAATLA